VVEPKYKKDLEINNIVEENQKIIKSYLNTHTHNGLVTNAILEAALEYRVPITIAFGLAWSESRFQPTAKNGIHNYNGTSDWGLFQLNDGYRENWTTKEFFDPHKNAKEAMRYLRGLMDIHGNNMIICLAAYNAGSKGIKDGITHTTLVHINNILKYSEKLEEEINEIVVK
jgi:soluble lytic murein transglycosylase-like protein